MVKKVFFGGGVYIRDGILIAKEWIVFEESSYGVFFSLYFYCLLGRGGCCTTNEMRTVRNQVIYARLALYTQCQSTGSPNKDLKPSTRLAQPQSSTAPQPPRPPTAAPDSRSPPSPSPPPPGPAASSPASSTPTRPS